jgi:hypothetical protein
VLDRRLYLGEELLPLVVMRPFGVGKDEIHKLELEVAEFLDEELNSALAPRISYQTDDVPSF